MVTAIITRLMLVPLLAVLSGCFQHVPSRQVASASTADQQAAARVRVFMVGQTAPNIGQVFGRVTGSSCKYLVTDAPASRAEAVERLQEAAARSGANAVVNVTFDIRGRDMNANCWEIIQASGTAVEAP